MVRSVSGRAAAKLIVSSWMKEAPNGFWISDEEKLGCRRRQSFKP
jgi:hypothetical protein